MRSTRRQAIEQRLARLEAHRPQPACSNEVPIPSDEELAAMTSEELYALCERVLATVQLTPEELAMNDDELSEHCRKLVEEDQRRAGLFN
jgi:hypothetical protein